MTSDHKPLPPNAVIEAIRRWNDWHAESAGLVPDGHGGYRPMSDAELRELAGRQRDG